MPKPTSGELATLKSHPQFVQRSVSVCPRAAVFACLVNGVASTDSVTGGQIAIPFDTVTTGAYTDVKVGMTLDVGTSAGARDIGSVRLRKAATSNTLYINETALGELPIVDNLYLTVRDEYLIWPKLWRLVATKTNGSKYVNSFTQYKNYEEAYVDQGSQPAPKVNIVTSVTAEGDYIPVKFAGRVDAGQTYRTVRLRAVGVPIASGATISGYVWDVGDGTITVGSGTTATITATFPAAKTWRHIRCTVTDSNGKTSYMVVPIVVHDAAHPPLSNFVVDRSEAGEGHELALTFFGGAGTASETVIPRQTAVIAWEEATFAGTAAPDVYISQRLLWTTRDTSLFKKDEPTWSMELAGAAYWLRGIAGPADTITYAAAPSTWSNMTSVTVDRLIAHVLHNYSTLWHVCTFRPTGNTYPTKERSINEGDLWSQVQALAKLGAANPWCDAAGGLALRPHPSYMTGTDYAAVTPYLTLTEADWPLDAALSLQTERSQQVGLTEVGGSAYYGSNEHLYLARAPGKTRSRAPGRQDETFLLPNGTGDLTRLKELAGLHFARLNNPRPDNSLPLLANLDCVEPGDVVRLIATSALTSTTIDELFVVTRVSSAHAVDFDTPPKQVTLGLEQVTRGAPGQQQEIPVSTTPGGQISNGGGGSVGSLYPGLYTPAPVPATPGLYPGVGIVAVFNDDGYVYMTENYYNPALYGGPHWSRVQYSALANWGGGTLLDFTVDAFSPAFLNTGSNVDGTLMSTTMAQRVTDILASIALAAADTLPGGASFMRQMQFERGVQNWGIIASYIPGTGTRASYTVDGLTFTDVSVSGSNRDSVNANLWSPGLWLDPHLAGHAIMSAFTSTGLTNGSATTDGFETFDYGATWNPISNPNILPGNGLSGAITASYADDSGKPTYFGQRTFSGSTYLLHLYRATGSGAPVDISPVLGGVTYGVTTYGQRALVAADSDPNTLVMVSGNHDTSGTGISPSAITRNAKAATPTWMQLTPPPGATFNRVYIAGSNANTLFFLGGNSLGYSTDGGLTIEDKMGDILTQFGAVGIFVGLTGK